MLTWHVTPLVTYMMKIPIIFRFYHSVSKSDAKPNIVFGSIECFCQWVLLTFLFFVLFYAIFMEYFIQKYIFI